MTATIFKIERVRRQMEKIKCLLGDLMAGWGVLAPGGWPVFCGGEDGCQYERRSGLR